MIPYKIGEIIENVDSESNAYGRVIEWASTITNGVEEHEIRIEVIGGRLDGLVTWMPCKYIIKEPQKPTLTEFIKNIWKGKK